MTTLYDNNVAGQLAAAITPSDTTLVLATGHGSLFPTVSGSDWFYATLIDPNTFDMEIVRVTAHAALSDTMTVVRGVDGTLSSAFPVDTVIEMRLVSQMLRELDYRLARGATDGIASLDANTLVPVAQIPNLPASQINSGVFTATLIPNLSATKITSGVLDAARIPSIDAAKVTTGTFAAARIPDLDAAKITTGAFDVARIPDLDAAKVTTGTFVDARIPTLAISKTTGLQAALDAKMPLTGGSFTGAVAIPAHTLTVKGGDPYGKRTISTAAPSGTPADGDEWIQREA